MRPSPQGARRETLWLVTPCVVLCCVSGGALAADAPASLQPKAVRIKVTFARERNKKLERIVTVWCT